MEQRFKLTIYSKSIYKEIELLPEITQTKIGTTIACDVRLSKELFFEDFGILLSKNNDAWTIQTTQNVYLDFGGSRKKWTQTIAHGDEFSIKYSNSDTELFKGRFYVDFDYENKNYERVIDISSQNKIVIGTEPSANIQLHSSYVYDDNVEIQRNGTQLIIRKIASQYGVFLNGRKLESSKELKNYDFFSIANFGFYYKDGKLYTDKKATLEFHGLSFTDISDGNSNLNYPKFHRNSRIRVKMNEEEISLLAPKEKPQKPKSNLLLKLLPALSMIILTVLLRGVMGGSNMSFILFSVCSMSIGAVVSVFTIINEKKEYNESILKRSTGYRSYIESKRNEIISARNEESDALNKIYLPFEKIYASVANFSGNIFDRIPDDEDFLDVKIGIGSLEALRKIEYKKQETYEADDDDLIDLPLNLSDNYKNVDNVPIVLHLKNANVIGIIGQDELLYEMLKVIMFDICVRQYYHDVKLFLFVPQKTAGKYQWARWFQHLENSDMNCRNIICDEESKTAIFEYLYAEFSNRENSKDKIHKPHIVVLVMDDYGIGQHPVSKYIEKASELGGSFVFFENDREHIPVGGSSIVVLNSENRGVLLDTADDNHVTEFTFSKISEQQIYALSHRMAPIYCEEISLEGALTKNITLYQLLGIMSEEDLDLKSRWASSDVTKTMAAPLGVRAGNEIVYLDLLDGDGHHGPHGLVAGTTGSGKSEVLMTYILSMATLFSPYEVAFLIIDFKGGGMGNQFKILPHTLGVITDIDGKEINRSLTSIKAELDRRKRLFADADVDHINKYIKAWKSKKVKTPLPHLIIIVDEFAELKAQFPDFMEELKSAARIGRTLGVHLILATQKPQGQVDPQIDSNSKFRLCLKVQTPEDSREVIKTPLAAEIREAGRAYLMVGNNEIFELFQSAYSGAPSGIDAASSQKEFKISAVDFAGRRKIIFERKHKKPAEGETVVTQKDAITKWIEEFFVNSKLQKLSDICQPPLPNVLKFKPSERTTGIGIYADLGMFDDPTQQKQDHYVVNSSAQHMLIIGTIQTGKTNVLQLIIRSLSESYSPDEVNFYIIDYSSMIMTSFNGLAHVGGVVVPNEDEKIGNLFKFLLDEIKERKQKFKNAGVSSFTSYREAGNTDIPLFVLLIDNLSALKESYLNDSPILLSILRDGLSIGISVIVANSTSKGLEYKYLSLFSCRIGLNHNNPDEYGNLFGGYKLSVSPIPGRCLVSVDRKTLDCQLYQAFEGEKEYQRIQMIGEFVSQVNTKYPQKKAILIPEIPEFLIENELRKQYVSMYGNYQLILGFDYDTLLPRSLDLIGLKLMISGTPKSGKGNFVRYIISCLALNSENAPVEICVFDRATVKKYAVDSQKHASIIRYELSSSNMGDICKEWKTELETRKQMVLANNGDISILDKKPLLLMICEDSSKEMLANFDETLFEFMAYKFSWIASNIDNEEISPMRSQKLYKIKNSGINFLLFGSFSASNVVDGFVKIPITEKRERLSVDVNVGDAFYVEANDMTKVYRLKTPQHN